VAIPSGLEAFWATSARERAVVRNGSLWGPRAYLDLDYSAEYLHRLSEVTLDTIATEGYGMRFAQLTPPR
jgi:nitric oxide reductase large subunit